LGIQRWRNACGAWLEMLFWLAINPSVLVSWMASAVGVTMGYLESSAPSTALHNISTKLASSSTMVPLRQMPDA
jgi:hypothetical protein